MIKKLIKVIGLGLSFLASIVFLFGCLKKSENCTGLTVNDEREAILAYAAANGMTGGSFDNHGVFFQIINAGSGANPTMNSKITANYTGKLISNNSVFDQNNSASEPAKFPLANVIVGWQVAIPKIAKGGSIKIIVPSSLAYGCYGRQPAIPGNAVLFFDIHLLGVE